MALFSLVGFNRPTLTQHWTSWMRYFSTIQGMEKVRQYRRVTIQYESISVLVLQASTKWRPIVSDFIRSNNSSTTIIHKVLKSLVSFHVYVRVTLQLNLWWAVLGTKAVWSVMGAFFGHLHLHMSQCASWRAWFELSDNLPILTCRRCITSQVKRFVSTVQTSASVLYHNVHHWLLLWLTRTDISPTYPMDFLSSSVILGNAATTNMNSFRSVSLQLGAQHDLRSYRSARHVPLLIPCRYSLQAS
jgi:hypothetical protein